MNTDVSTLMGQLVAVTVPDGKGGEHRVYGRLSGTQNISITVSDAGGRRMSYEASSVDVAREPDLRPVEPWLVVAAEHGGDIPTPPGSTGMWGSQEPNSPFFLVTEDWSFRYGTLRVREASDAVRIEPMGPAGVKWIEDNLTTDARVARLTAKIEALDPALASELDDVLYRVRDEGKWEARREEMDRY